MLSFVPRWSIAPRLTQQSDAEHCYFVALYTSQLCHLLQIPEKVAWIAVGWALRHDAPEIWTGDPPGPAKKHFIDEEKHKAYVDQFAEHVHDFRDYRAAVFELSPGMRDLILRVVKVADLMDECFYLRYELALGNSMVKDLYQLALDRLEAKVHEWGENIAMNLLFVIKRELSRVEGEGALIPSLK